MDRGVARHQNQSHGRPPKRSRLRGLVAIAMMSSVALGGAAWASSWMTDADLNQTFRGITIDGTYANGLTFRERYGEDGSVDYRESDGRTLTGHWSVVAGAFCTIYTLSGTGGCFRVRRLSANCFTFYFQARSEAEVARPEPGKPAWTARGWRIDQPATCNETPVV